MTTTETAPLGFIDGLGSVAADYDVILCDVWGVIHNGIAAYPDASDALQRFRAGGGRVILVSNAPRPGASVGRQLDRLGVPRNAYDAVVTSGDITREQIAERSGRVVLHIGPPRDLPIFEGLDVSFGSAAEAEYVVCSGFDEPDESQILVDDYRGRLQRLRDRDLWMLCANPDLVVERGHTLIPCAGAIAALYEEMGGEVYYAGKPHRPIYEAALARAARLAGDDGISPKRVLAVGDALRTDIAGAAGFGIESLLVARGIHAAELKLDQAPLNSSHVQDWLTGQSVRPDFVVDKLVW
jgi:HAD superfamily hydrolase (TIGR01459 family)